MVLIVDKDFGFSQYSHDEHRDMDSKCDVDYIENSESIHELQHG